MFTTPREAGAILRSRREAAGLTQDALATQAGVSLRWLVSFENGKSSVDMSKVLDCFYAVGAAFDVVGLGTHHAGAKAGS